MTLEQLKASNRIFFECRSGSFAYGTNTEKSDTDIRGLFYQPLSELVSFNAPDLQVSDERNDIVYYSLRRYIELACEANPNILELLYMPDDCIRHSSPAFELLKKNRKIFISQKCIQTHHAYAVAQIKKARGRNKWINNPQPESKPSLDQFCYFLPKHYESMPYRPIKFVLSGLDKNKLKCSSVEHCPGVYRLYSSNTTSTIFTNDSIKCSSIPKDEEDEFNIGLLYVNADAYKRALTDHKNYWGWIKNRNPNRWNQQEKGEMDFDAKNMQHTLRLMLTAESIMETGEPIIRFDGEKLQFLKDIRKGVYSYNELIQKAEETTHRVKASANNSTLPEEASKDQADKLFLELSTLLSSQ